MGRGLLLHKPGHSLNLHLRDGRGLFGHLGASPDISQPKQQRGVPGGKTDEAVGDLGAAAQPGFLHLQHELVLCLMKITGKQFLCPMAWQSDY